MKGAVFKNAKHESNPSGTILIDNQEVAHTKQCCHCQEHFVSVKGSGKIRGFCPRCMQITCGKPACNTCTPFEKKLEDYEKGKIKTL